MSKYIGARKFALGNGFKSFREMLNYAELVDHKNPTEHAAYIEWVDNDLSKAGIKALTRGKRVKLQAIRRRQPARIPRKARRQDPDLTPHRSPW